ncbi:MAG: hypothetical protein K6E79_00330 [Pseudobutyrivibrio sp.]|nr:hypothetical protein [Pseudobutyrivibrio sp.]
MRSKTSFFNKAVFKKNLSRTWAAGLLYFLILSWMLPVGVLLDISAAGNYTTRYTPAMNLSSRLSSVNNGFYPMIYVIILAIITFSYLFSKRDNYMIHSFPVSRKSLFFTGLCSITIVAIIPVILTGITTTAVAFANGVYDVTNVWYWVFIQVASTILFMGLSLFSMMLTGQTITAVLFYGIFNFLYYMMEFSMRIVGSSLIFGMMNAGNDLDITPLTPVMYITYNCRINFDLIWDDKGENLIGFTQTFGGAKELGIYMAVGVVLLIVAFVLYKFKNLETVQDFITVPFVKPIFSMGLSFFVSIVIGTIIVSALNVNSNFSYNKIFALTVLFTIISGIVIYYITLMLIAKTIRVCSLKNACTCVLYSIISIVVLLCIRFDVCNIENYTPDLEKVEWAGINIESPMVFTDESEIQQVINLQKAIIQDKREIRDFNINDIGTTVTFKYMLKSGKTVTREYYLVDNNPEVVSPEYYDTTKPLLDFVNTPERIKKHIIGPQWDNCTVKNVTFYQLYYNEEKETLDSYENSFSEKSKAEIQEAYDAVYAALLKDIDAGVIYQQTLSWVTDDDHVYYNNFDIELTPNDSNMVSDSDIFWGNILYSYYVPTNYMDCYEALNDKCVNTLNALKEYEFFYSEDQLFTNSQAYSLTSY